MCYNFLESSRVGANVLLGVSYIFSCLDGRGQLCCNVFMEYHVTFRGARCGALE